jgi:hypothetical protein
VFFKEEDKRDSGESVELMKALCYTKNRKMQFTGEENV